MDNPSVKHFFIPVNIQIKPQIDNFIKTITRAARHVHNTKDKLGASKYNKFIIVGDIGIGKTTFLNFIFSRYYQEFDLANVLYIRIDLTKEANDLVDLFTAAKAQLANIVKKYYRNLLTGFSDKAKQVLGDDKSAILKINEYLITAPSIDEVSTRESFRLLNDKLYDYIKNQKSLIFVFDGFDRVKEGENFDRHVQEINKIWGSEKYKDLYILVMRKESHSRLFPSLKATEIAKDTHLRGKPYKFCIDPVMYKDVFEARLNLLTYVWQEKSATPGKAGGMKESEPLKAV